MQRFEFAVFVPPFVGDLAEFGDFVVIDVALVFGGHGSAPDECRVDFITNAGHTVGGAARFQTAFAVLAVVDAVGRFRRASA